jgi:transmembrane sensor
MVYDAHRFSRHSIEDFAAQWVTRRDAGLSPAEEHEMRQWAAADPAHQAALDQFEAAWTALATPARGGATGEFELEVRRIARRHRLAIVTRSVAVLAIVGLTFVSWRQLRPNSVVASAHTVIHAPERRILPDGSVVELKSNSEIRVAYSPAQRRIVLLRGEAHFEVVKDRNRPFVVSARNVAVRAIGTAFDVQIDTSNVQVLVTEGTVAVEHARAGTAADGAVPVLPAVGAGKAVTLPTSAVIAPPAVRSVAPDEMNERLAWRKSRIQFNKTPLSHAVAVMNSHSPLSASRLVVADSATGEVSVIGVFRPDNVEGFVALLEAGGFNIKAERSANQITLRKIH